MTEIEDEQEIDKILGQFRLVLGGVLHPLRLYGQGAYVDSVVPEIIKLAWHMHWKLAGLDVPYEIDDLHW